MPGEVRRNLGQSEVFDMWEDSHSSEYMQA